MIWLQQLQLFLLEHCHSKLQQMDQFWAHRGRVSSLVPGDEALKFFHLARRIFHPKTITHCIQMNIFLHHLRNIKSHCSDYYWAWFITLNKGILNNDFLLPSHLCKAMSDEDSHVLLSCPLEERSVVH